MYFSESGLSGRRVRDVPRLEQNKKIMVIGLGENIEQSISKCPEVCTSLNQSSHPSGQKLTLSSESLGSEV